MTRTRSRRLAWALLGAASVVALLFALSIRIELGCHINREREIACTEGLIVFAKFADGTSDVWPHAVQLGPFYANRGIGRIGWWFSFHTDSWITELAIPLWIPPLLLLLPGAFLLHRTRHIPGHCPTCHYNLTGLPPNSPCPECGRAPTQGAIP